ncbi:uncharacterized protein N7500_010909 [Penicillium coprophilum]|uniref:uncharacterized protein n=1 Tax=Penicillium coprophilum TaxID=36646 RepID=UPI00238C56B5|nr:uncharacterized protein N7500_010909 [Penicillium coprophilum]KAJ5150720.1 hypothetical protein N7500_010909 [Penicillium coprophilum]
MPDLEARWKKMYNSLSAITPITTSPFDNVVGALSHIRSGQHIGKIVVSLGDNDDVQVPIRPAIWYLIVGSLKGAFGILAIYLARHEVKHIRVMIEAKGDVADFEVVSELFRLDSPRIVGIVQGAMVLRDKPYEIMTLDDLSHGRPTQGPGNLNLHRAAELHSTPLSFLTLLSGTSSIGTESNARLDKRIWTLINEGTLRKILTYSILQQDPVAPPSTSTSIEIVTGAGFPLPVKGTGAGSDPRLSYMFNGNADATGVEASDSSDSVDQAILAFCLMHNSGADIAALGKVGLEVISGQFVKPLRLETEPEAAQPLIEYGLDLLSAVELRDWIRIKLESELTMLDITIYKCRVSDCPC